MRMHKATRAAYRGCRPGLPSPPAIAEADVLPRGRRFEFPAATARNLSMADKKDIKLQQGRNTQEIRNEVQI